MVRGGAPWDFDRDVRGIVWALRIALSAVYGIDLAIRGVLARHPVRYALANPLALASVFLPPVRVIFSLRLARSMFRRGHLARFLLAAAVVRHFATAARMASPAATITAAPSTAFAPAFPMRLAIYAPRK